MDEERKEFGKWWMWAVLLLAITTIIFGGLSLVGIIGERVAFTQSYQRSAGLKQQIATYEAQLSELRIQLGNPALDEGERINIRAQISSINIQLKSARGQQ